MINVDRFVLTNDLANGLMIVSQIVYRSVIKLNQLTAETIAHTFVQLIHIIWIAIVNV